MYKNPLAHTACSQSPVVSSLVAIGLIEEDKYAHKFSFMDFILLTCKILQLWETKAINNLRINLLHCFISLMIYLGYLHII